MMQLPALSPEERACLQSGQPDKALPMLAERLRRRLVASLGVTVFVNELPGGHARALPHAGEPVIEIDPELAGAWLAARLGGTANANAWPVRDAALLAPLVALIRRALAETVVNLGEAAWPQAMRLQVVIGPQPGAVEIFWNSERAMPWARRTIREKT